MKQKFNLIKDIREDINSWEFRRESALTAGYATSISGGNYLHSLSASTSVSRCYEFPTYFEDDFHFTLDRNWGFPGGEKNVVLESPNSDPGLRPVDIGFEYIHGDKEYRDSRGSVIILSEAHLPAGNDRLYGLFLFFECRQKASQIAFEFYDYLRDLFKASDIRVAAPGPQQLTLPSLDFLHNRTFQL